MEMNNNKTKELMVPLFQRLQLLKNGNCQKCDAKSKAPLIPWIIGENYEQSQYRLMFVGKPHRGKPETQLSENAFSMDDYLEDLMAGPWPYWSYTREIADALYGTGKGWDNVAFSNVVKCTNVPGGHGNGTADETTPNMLDSCIMKNRVIWEEVKMLKPLNLIFYTYDLCCVQLDEIPFAKEIQEIHGRKHQVPCGEKHIGWWERTVETDWDKMRVLVTSHPERKKKADFIRLLQEWIKG